MTDSAKQTALFFGFVTAAMTYASAQATPVHPQPTGVGAAQQTMVEKTKLDRKRVARIEHEIKISNQRRSKPA
ncbi:hypothetical protein [Chenggangzhangella methanolivorans]|uniref:Uncharacterized protein n=1 Tax=Chenggangzhangella methanolivorans TaxID=1437009 RepID=A0A9E6UP33_9HYPH|nr:hypothetical protein [Chenggangzhangella methanolivorans]QZO00964.1 hypothetical protein K6K41_04940 [Chenggangzhangella methanolivorans]